MEPKETELKRQGTLTSTADSAKTANDLAKHENHWREARKEFVRLKGRYTRISAVPEDGRPFILLRSLTKELKKANPKVSGEQEPFWQNNFERLCKAPFFSQSLDPPELKTLDFETCSGLYFTLVTLNRPLFLPLFIRQGFSDEQLPIDEGTLARRLHASFTPYFPTDGELNSFIRDFAAEQYKWCPVTLHTELHKVVGDRILPFYVKEKIQPDHASHNRRTNNATVWKVEVPEDFVSIELQQKLPQAQIDEKQCQYFVHTTEDLSETDEESPCVRENVYRYALKEFSLNNRSAFDKECMAFRALPTCEGIVEYICWFERGPLSHVPRTRTTNILQEQGTCNILLEFGEQDFQTVIMLEMPPVSSEKILMFWRNLLRIAVALEHIHNFELDKIWYNAWHGDLKPENILDVQGHFKLADPGETRICRVKSHNRRPSRRDMTGGPQKYAPPEKTSNIQTEEVFQTSDVWSLACVLSVAASYVVLGTQGVVVYDEIRRMALKDLANPNIKAGDGFHDGRGPLAIIGDWHMYLKDAARQADPWTGQILTMIDEHMLLGDGKRRWEASQVRERFENILRDTPPDTECPGYIQERLDSIDMQEVIDRWTIERETESNSSDEAADGTQSVTDAPSSRSSTRKQAEASNLRGLLSPLQRTHPPSPPHQRRSRLHELRTEDRDGRGRSWQDSVSSSASMSSMSRLSLGKSLSIDAQQAYAPQAGAPPFSNAAQVPGVDAADCEDFGEVQNWCQVEELLESMAPRSHRTLPSLKELKALRRNGNVMSRDTFKGLLRKREIPIKGNMTGPPDELGKYFDNRDLVFLVDNGSTMRRHWSEATKLLRVLVWRTMGYDDDGLELSFTNPDTAISVPQSQNQGVQEFVDAMAKGRPKPGGHIKTDIRPTISSIIHQYSADKFQPKGKMRCKSIIVLTDGLWEGLSDEDVKEWIDTTLHLVQFAHDPRTNGQRQTQTGETDLAKNRHITIQFISFGNDEKALDRLRYLDDGVEERNHVDLIDTEPSYGDVYKMLLGPLDEKYDRRRTVHPPATPIASPKETGRFSSSNTQMSWSLDGSVDSSSLKRLSMSSSPMTSPVSPTLTKSEYQLSDRHRHYMGSLPTAGDAGQDSHSRSQSATIIPSLAAQRRPALQTHRQHHSVPAVTTSPEDKSGNETGDLTHV